MPKSSLAHPSVIITYLPHKNFGINIWVSVLTTEKYMVNNNSNFLISTTPLKIGQGNGEFGGLPLSTQSAYE